MTMKTYLALALLITVLAGNAYGEDEVYYCVTTKSVGLSKDKETGEYMPTNFTGTRKFTLKHKKISLSTGQKQMAIPFMKILMLECSQFPDARMS